MSRRIQASVMLSAAWDSEVYVDVCAGEAGVKCVGLDIICRWSSDGEFDDR